MKYTRCCGFDTTAIIPLSAFTIPSMRIDAITSPALPGGRFGSPPGLFTSSSEWNGSRRAAGAGFTCALAGVDPAGAILAAAGFLALGFFDDFFCGVAAGAAGGVAGVCACARSPAGPPTTRAAAAIVSNIVFASVMSLVLLAYRFAGAVVAAAGVVS